MIRLRVLISGLFILIYSVWSVQAQCDFDVDEIIQQVSNACQNVGENQVCYGNRNVTAFPRGDNVSDFEFNSPGDLVALSNIGSLVVDAVDVQNDLWGVAQMRLIVGSEDGVQDISMLLFGDFNIENTSETGQTLNITIDTIRRTIYREPNFESAVVEEVTNGTTITAIGRLEDTSWIQVENPATRIIGWIDANGIATDATLGLAILPVQDPDMPFYGAMQAFYFENGQTDIGCNSVASDGLIIQTPEGNARVSLLINEVSIELVGGRDELGNDVNGTAFIQANPETEEGMSVNVLQGLATVRTSADQEPTTVERGQRSSIPISVDLQPLGAPSIPDTIEDRSVNVDSLLPVVSAPREFNSTTGSGSGTINANTSGSTTSSPNSNTGGNPVVSSSGSTTGSSTSGGSTTSSNSNGRTSSTSDGTGASNGLGSLPSANGAGNGDTTTTPANTNGISAENANAVALAIAISAGVLVLSVIIWTTVRRDN